ncbi:MAG: serine/threonine-protein kinase [Planctomycetota bacterium]
MIASRYALAERIGQGGAGEVYRAFDTRLQRLVAVKVLHGTDTGVDSHSGSEAGSVPPTEAAVESGGASSEGAASGSRRRSSLCWKKDEAAAAAQEQTPPLPEESAAPDMVFASDPVPPSSTGLHRFEAEARAVARLQHEGIVRVLDSGVDRGRPFLVMELVEGPTLAELVRRGSVPLEARVRAVAEAGEAVAYAHLQGVLHRDLKPANVLIDRDGRARVVDFGLALDRSRETRITRTGELLGTPAYLAPESARGESTDERTDVYGLGATLYEAVCGRPPFRGRAAWEVLRAVLEENPEPPRQVDPKTPWDLQAVILKALEKSANHRYGSAREFARDLRRFLAGDPVVARRVKLGTRTRWYIRQYRKSLFWVALAVVFGLGLLARQTGFEVEQSLRARAEEILARVNARSTLDEEIALAERSLEMDSSFHRARVALGRACIRKARRAAREGDAANRAKAFERGLSEFAEAAADARRPIAALAFSLHGQAIDELAPERVEDARKSYEAAASYRLFDTPPVVFARARLRELDGESIEALALYDALLTDDPYFEVAFVRRSRLRLEQGDAEGALVDAVRALELRPEDAGALAARAAARARLGKFD